MLLHTLIFEQLSCKHNFLQFIYVAVYKQYQNRWMGHILNCRLPSLTYLTTTV